MLGSSSSSSSSEESSSISEMGCSATDRLVCYYKRVVVACGDFDNYFYLRKGSSTAFWSTLEGAGELPSSENNLSASAMAFRRLLFIWRCRSICSRMSSYLSILLAGRKALHNTSCTVCGR